MFVKQNISRIARSPPFGGHLADNDRRFLLVDLMVHPPAQGPYTERGAHFFCLLQTDAQWKNESFLGCKTSLSPITESIFTGS